MSIVLTSDLVIPAGTVFEQAPSKTQRYGDDHFEAVIGFGADNAGYFTVCMGDMPEGVFAICEHAPQVAHG